MRLSKLFSLLLFVAGIQLPAKAQLACPTLSGLPDTFRLCKDVRNVPLPTPSLNGVPVGTVFFDSSYYIGSSPRGCNGAISPNGILSNPNLNNPFNTLGQSVTVSTTSMLVTLRIRTLDTNIVTNSGFQSGLLGFSTDYFPAPLNVTSPETYDFVLNSTDANPTFVPFVDNNFTGTSPRNMMAVKGSTTPGKVVLRYTFNATAGKDYRIIYYAQNAIGFGNPPVLDLRINGVSLTDCGAQNPFPLGPAGSGWQRIENFYSCTTTGPLTLTIVNNNLNVQGNSFALDDLTVEPMCVAKDSVYVEVANLNPLIQSKLFEGCDEDTVEFKADTVGGVSSTQPNRFFWEFGDGSTDTAKDPTHIYQSQGTYAVKLTVYKTILTYSGAIDTCSETANKQVVINHPFTAGFIQDKIRICQGEEVSFTDTSKPEVGLLINWQSGDGDTSVLESPKFTYDSAGVYTVRQIVTDNFGCNDTATSLVISIGTPKGSFSLTDTTLCEGQSLIANAVLDSTFELITWNFGDGRIVTDSTKVRQSYLDEGIYDIVFTATHPVCPDVTLTRQVSVSQSPRVNLGADTSICPMGQPIYLFSNIAGNAIGTRYRWENGDSSATRLIRHDGRYYLAAFNDLGCSAVDTIIVAKDCYLDIPNVFSPGSEGSSAYFLPRQDLAKGLQKFTMKVYNRWGQQVFETNRTDGRGWDGRFNGEDQPMGVYIYRIEAAFANGATEKYEGNVTLLR